MSDYKNIVGTAFPNHIKEQLDLRGEKISASTRDNQTLQYLTNRNSWVRLSSGANTKTDNGYSNDLAKEYVLQGGAISMNYVKDGDNKEKYKSTDLRKGFNETYTQGATDNLGFKPMPGIVGVSVGTGGKWQTLMQANIEIIAYDLDQLDIIQKLYMSLGCTVFLEWGHTNYFKNDGTFQKNPRGIHFFQVPNKKQLLRNGTTFRTQSSGNYECIVGTVYNFDWSSNPDGSYNCKIKVMGPGGMVESLRINTTSNIDFNIFDQDNDSAKYTSVLSNALGTIKSYLEKSGVAIQTGPYRNFGVINNENFLGKNLLVKNSKEEPLSYADILNDIYSKAQYKGPQFLGSNAKDLKIDFKANDFLKYGNAWQLLAGYETIDKLTPIDLSLYHGYTSVATVNDEKKTKLSYITFGHLMTLIQHIGIFVEGSKNSQGKISSTRPAVHLDYNPENTIISTGVLEASIDPSKCMIPYKVNRMDSADSERDSLKKFFFPLNVESKDSRKAWYKATDLGNEVKNFLTQKKGQSKIETTPKVSQINKVEPSINFGGKLFNILVNLDFAIKTLEDQSNNNEDKSVNLIEYLNAILDGINISLGKVNSFRTFFDDSSHCIRIVDENVVDRDALKKNIYEIKPFGTQSIAYDYGFSSKVSPKLASQIVISTQQGGGISDFPEDVLSYQKLNADIEDRFAQAKVPSVPPQNTKDETNGQDKKSLQTLFDHIYNVYNLQNDINLNTISNLTTTYSDLQSRNKQFWSKTAGTVLIPLEYNLTIDGISGILPYTAFKVPNNRLPKKYKDRVGFAVFSINHEFNNNQWTTKLRGQTLLLDNNLQQDVREVEISQVESDLSRDPTSLALSQGFTTGFVIPAVPSIPQQGGSNALKPIKDILAKFESNGDYDVANVGTAGRVSTIKVSNKTIGELRTYWALPKENSNRVFAMGRYQFIPQSLVGVKKDPFELLPEGQGGILRGVGLLDKDLFSPANQEKIVDAVLTTSIKRRNLGAYISAANNGSRKDLEDAIQDIGNEWASMPVIFDSNRARVGDVENGSGNSAYYGGRAGNPSVAKVTVLQMVKAVIQARENFTSQRPEFVPSYYL